MKNQKLIIASLSVCFFSLMLSTVNAQDINTRIGGMVAYGTEIEMSGLEPMQNLELQTI